MTKDQEHLEALHDIKHLMEKSTKFISLSGLSGVFVGILALAGAYIANWHLNIDSDFNDIRASYISLQTQIIILIDGAVVLFGSLLIGIFFTYRKAKRLGQSLFDKTAKRLFYNMMIPLSAGGILCLILLLRGDIFLIAPLTLLFYGLALLNASNYTVKEIRYLGISEIVLGLIATVFLGQGLLFWALGFGFLHIFYGIAMYLKYDKK